MPENQARNHLTEVAFSSLDLLPAVQDGLARVGFTHCTPIQALTLPLALNGRDVAGQAHTGTGKTAAFLLVIFQRLLQRQPAEPGRHPRALVLAPTRELALQIHKDALLLGGETGLRFGLAYGQRLDEADDCRTPAARSARRSRRHHPSPPRPLARI